jgi:peptide/nickel transport system substrate-binding protein
MVRSEGRVLTLSGTREPSSLFAALNTAGGTDAVRRLFGAGLTVVDDAAVIRPELATEVPRLNSDTWRILPDGRMETTYRLRLGLTWHDGKPLEAADFAFAYRVQTHPAGMIPPSDAQELMESVTAADATTLVIRWRSAYPRANDLGITPFSPLPRHLLGDAFARLEQDAVEVDAFLNLPYWLGAYVGVGPFGLVAWEPGVHFAGVAFDNFALGKPKIERVVIKVMEDRAVMTEVLAGTMDVGQMNFEHYQLLEDWVRSGKGTLLMSPGNVLPTHIQMQLEYVGHPALRDLRVRRALMHTLDRQALNEGVFDGRGMMTETIVPPNALFFAQLDRAITKYQFDPRRAEQLMNEAEFTRDSSGLFVDSGGKRFVFEHERLLASDRERIQLIMLDTWRRAGFDVTPTVSPQRATQEHLAKSPGLRDGGGAESSFYGPNLATAANRWTGANKTGFANVDYDRLYEAFNGSLDQPERLRQFIEMQRVISEQIPAFVHHFQLNTWAVGSHLAGVKAETKNIGDLTPSTFRYFNVHEWEWT